MKKFIIALDQGTTSSRAIAFDRSGMTAGSASIEFSQIFPQAGWVEHVPEEIYKSQMRALRTMLETSGIKPGEIHAIGITNQRETTVLWDKVTGDPVYNAIVWQCRRTAKICEQLKNKGYSNKIKQKTGLLPDAYFSATKIKWMLDNVPKASELARNGRLAAGTVDSWLMYKMSGGKIHATDETNASRTMLYNIRENRWDEELCDMLDIPMSILPEVVDSSSVIFDFDMDGFKIPVAGIAGDQQAALFGQCCFDKGDVKNTYGTGCFILMNAGGDAVASSKGLLTTVAWRIGGRTEYALEGSVFNAGSVVQWMRDNLNLLDDAAKSEEIANSVEDTGGVFLVPAFTGLGTPYWDMYARGAITGITRGTSKEHIVRAGLEAVAYRSAEVMEVMKEESGIAPKSLHADGGASVNGFLMQFQSDITGVEIEVPAIRETTSMGAAFLAGLATGFWKDRKELSGLRSVEKTYKPQMGETERMRRLGQWKMAVKKVCGE
jgi:glycerol kinase